MADETTAKPAADDQTATDPRLEQQTEATPVAGAAPETGAEGGTEGEGGEGAAPAAEATPETAPEAEKKPKRSAEEVLKGRVGHLTKTLSTKDAALADAQARLAAAEALLAAHGRAAPAEGAEGAPAPAQPPQGGIRVGERVLTQAEYEADIAASAAAKEFNKAADALYDTGKARFPDWKEAVDTLGGIGVMSPTLLDAVMATDDGAGVVHHLSEDLDEAMRIAALPPVRMAAELTKLGTKLAAPKTTPVSGAPAPIRPVTGAAAPVVDLERAAADGGNNMAAYRAARAKQGSPYALSFKERQALARG